MVLITNLVKVRSVNEGCALLLTTDFSFKGRKKLGALIALLSIVASSQSLPVWALSNSDAWEVRAPVLWGIVESNLQNLGKMSRYELNEILGSTNLYLDDDDAKLRPYQYQLDRTTRLTINCENDHVLEYSLQREIPNHFKLVPTEQVADHDDSSDANFLKDNNPRSKKTRAGVDRTRLPQNKRFCLIQSRVKRLLKMNAEEIVSLLGTPDRRESRLPSMHSNSFAKHGGNIEELLYNLDDETTVIFVFADSVVESVRFSMTLSNTRPNFEVAPTVVDDRNQLNSH